MKNYIKRTPNVIMYFALFAIFFLVFLGVAFVHNNSNAESLKTPASYEDTWKSSGDVKMTATIKNNEIDLVWHLDRESDAMYWIGSFYPQPDSFMIESSADVKAMENLPFASHSASKTFKYIDGDLQYDFTVLGVTKHINLKRQ